MLGELQFVSAHVIPRLVSMTSGSVPRYRTDSVESGGYIGTVLRWMITCSVDRFSPCPIFPNSNYPMENMCLVSYGMDCITSPGQISVGTSLEQ